MQMSALDQAILTPISVILNENSVSIQVILVENNPVTALEFFLIIRLSPVNEKTFPVVRGSQKIGGFSQNSKRDILITNKGLQEKVNVSDSDEKSLKNLADLPEPKFVSFSSQQDRNIKLYYLASVGDTSPVLLFQEVTEEVNILDLLTEDNKILIRLDNYEEFYNSYFYITLH